MKILPDYLINIMPDIEDAIEEVRLSVVDHAYDLLNCLDADELSSAIVREKLKTVGLSIDKMSESWSPNGKFYKIYALIKNNRTRLNAVKSIVNSGGQFEGLWSDEFVKTPEYNYKSIQTLRHYYLPSGVDGYFYISGDTEHDSEGHVISSALTALSSDILVQQALPAGYTYLYLPWPVPVYPAESGYRYNVWMLMFDRLYCDYTHNGYNYYSDYLPSSTNYSYAEKTNNTPFWIDYHFIGNEYHDDEYIDDSNAIFPTTYYLHSHSTSSEPNTIQTLEFIDSDYSLKHQPIYLEDRSYLFDVLSYYIIKDSYEINHIKEHMPLWSAASVMLDIVQNGIYEESRSLLNLFKFKEDNYIFSPSESTISENKPAVSERVFTDSNMPVLNKTDEYSTAYVNFAISRKSIPSYLSDFNEIYPVDSTSPLTYEDGKNYIVTGAYCQLVSTSEMIFINDTETLNKLRIVGDPADNTLWLQAIDFSDYKCVYVTYKTSVKCKFYTDPESTSLNTKLYKNKYSNTPIDASDVIFKYSATGRNILFNNIRVFDKSGKEIKDDSVYVSYSTEYDSYEFTLNKSASYNSSYITCDISFNTITILHAFDTVNGTDITVIVDESGNLSVDGGETWMTEEEFKSSQYVMKENSEMFYFGGEEITVYSDGD